jgi:hypothetical protein
LVPFLLNIQIKDINDTDNFIEDKILQLKV